MKHDLDGGAARKRRVSEQRTAGANPPRSRLRAARSGIVATAVAATIAGLAIGVAPSYGATPASLSASVHAKPAPSPVPERHSARPKAATPKPVHASPVPKPVHASPVPKPVHASPVPKPVHASPVPKPVHARPIPKPVPSGSSAAAPVARSGGSDSARTHLVRATSRAIEHGDRPALEFVAADEADVARGERAVDCLRAKGVALVELGAPDDEGIRYLEFGGKDDDRRSISLGMRYADACIAAAAR